MGKAARIRGALGKLHEAEHRDRTPQLHVVEEEPDRFSELREQYTDEDSVCLLPRRAINEARREAEGWHRVRTITIIPPCHFKLDILWKPPMNGQPEEVVACYAFHR